MLSKCGSPPPARNLSLSISDRVEVRTKSMDDSESRSSPDGEVPVVRTMLEFCKIGSVCSNVEADIVLCWLERQHWVPGYGTLCKRCTYLCRDEKKKESGDGEFETIGSQGTLLIGEDTLDLPQGYTAFLQQDKDGPLGGDSGTNIECQPHEHKGSGNESRDIGLPQFAAKDVRNGGSERCVCCTWKLLAVQNEESNKAKGYDEGGVERKEVPGLKGAEEASPATGLSIAYGVGRVLMKLLLHCGRDEQGNRLANKQRPGAAGPSYASVKAAADGVPASSTASPPRLQSTRIDQWSSILFPHSGECSPQPCGCRNLVCGRGEPGRLSQRRSASIIANHREPFSSSVGAEGWGEVGEEERRGAGGWRRRCGVAAGHQLVEN